LHIGLGDGVGAEVGLGDGWDDGEVIGFGDDGEVIGFGDDEIDFFG